VALGGRPVLNGMGFSLAGGQVVAIVGRNGVGKTTLLRALAGLQAHAGSVSVDGQTPDVGMVFQNADLQLFNASVHDEILYRVPDPDEALYEWLLAALGLDRYQDTPPLLLSEGEKKRVALATVLMRRPRHGLLLDEPSLGQDAAHKAMLIRLCHALAQSGRLVILTTHDLQLAAQADRLLLLGADGFVAEGPPAVVLRSEGPWQRIGLPVPHWVTDALPPPVIPGADATKNPAPARPDSSPSAQIDNSRRRPWWRRLRGSRRLRQPSLVENSPLRRTDPRTKLALSLCASLAVMLDMEHLLAFTGLYILLLLWARLLPQAARQVWRLKWVLILLFAVDWIFVSPDLAWIVSLRIIVLTGVFALLFSTTTPAELRLALEWAHVPYRYAFSLTLAFQSVGLLDDEWRAIREAQRARGAWFPPTGWRNLTERVRDLVALSVPAVVLVTKLAWAMTEAAYARGFDSPHRKPYRVLAMRPMDWVILCATAAVAAVLLMWR
jgi:energy-coupling factor transporter ATP-binding protein EcfA2/energy-coupling factor transporter transmembrane protein EcfT